MRMSVDVATLPVWALIAVGGLAVLEFALDVVALVNLYRRPTASVTLGNKWIWVAIIVLVGLIGAILYFAIGRQPTPASEGERLAPRRSSADIADALYGGAEEPKER